MEKGKTRGRFGILDKIPLHFLLVFLFVVLILLLNYQYGSYVNNPQNPASITFKEMELKCLDRFNEGILYEQDLICHQGPFFYTISYNLREIFKEDFYLAVIIFSVIIYVLMFLFLYKIVEKEVGGFYFLSLILYVAFIFVYGLQDFYFSILLALFWFFFGFYLLFYTNVKFKEFFVGVVFALSFLIKPTYLIPIGVSLLFYCIKILKIKIKGKKFSFVPKRIYKILSIVSPIVVVLLIFHLWFPNFLVYMVNLADPALQSEERNLVLGLFSEGFFTAFSKVFYILTLQFDLVKIFLIFIAVLTLYLVIKRRGFIETYTFFLFLITSLNSFVSGNNIIEYRRIIFVIPFFIVVLLKVIKNSKGNLVGRCLLFLIFVLLLYPALKIVYLEHQISELEYEVGYVMHFIPKQDRILADRDRLKFYDYELDYDINLISGYISARYDPHISPALEKIGLVNVSAWKFEELKKEGLFYSILIKDIAEKKYDSIMFLPKGEGRGVERLLLYIKGLSKEKNISFKELFPMGCHIYIPTLEERCKGCDHKIKVYFLNGSHCENMKVAIVNYYKDHFESICEKDKYVGNFVLSAFIYNGINFREKCEEEGNLLESYSHIHEITKRDFLFIIISFTFILISYLFKKEKRKLFFIQLKEGYKNNKKFLFIIILLILMMGTLYISSKVFIVCEKDYIKVEDKKKCCPDFNGDGKCDEDNLKEDVNECLIIKESEQIVIGRTCASTEDCIRKARYMGFPNYYLNSEMTKCKKTYFKTMDELIECETKQDCLNSFTKEVDLQEVVRCGNDGFCQMTIYSFLSLRNVYSVN